MDDTAELAQALARFPSLASYVTVEPDDRYARVVLTLRHGQTEAIWGDGYTRVDGELMRYEGFLAAAELANTLDVLRMIDAFDGRIGRIASDGECLVRVSAGWTESAAHWWSRRKTREPALQIEYSQVSWASGVDPTTRVEYSDTLIIEGLREEVERLQAGRWLELGHETPVEWLSAADSAGAADQFSE